MRAILLTILTTLSLSTAAVAEGKVGVGAETSLGTLTTPSGAIVVVYDATQWRLDGLIGMFVVGEALNMSVGGRFHYVVNSSERADFSLGAGAFFLHGARGQFGGGESNRGEIDAIAQIRVFLVPNVALQGAVGMGVSFGDGGVALQLAGQLTGSLGLVYFF